MRRPGTLTAVSSTRRYPGSVASTYPTVDGAGIRLDGLSKSFRSPEGPVHAVRDIDVAIARGETVGLLGPNGAGKSTTIDMLLGLQPPDSGGVSLFGRTPRQAVDAGLVGAMLQTGALIQYLSVRELLTMMASIYPAPLGIAEVLEQTGLEAIAGRRTQKLSGGETQRVRFALAIVSDPDLLVLDEPTVAMDVESRHEFWNSMRAFAARGKTVIFATHYLEEADQNADRVVLMAHGRIVADGPPTEIKGRVGSRTIRATLADASPGELSALPGVASADRHGESVLLICADSDQAIRALLERFPAARDIEITGAGLEDAFLALTADGDSDAPDAALVL
jgi:ABC-2 type transport system ATP-binding protein